MASGAPASITQPVRNEAIDALRGFAVLGILIANMESHSRHFMLTAERQAGLALAASDPWAQFMLGWLFQGKFYALFSLLFGLGFAILMQSAERRGEPIAPTYRRRLGVLVAIGLAHTLIWPGDILLLYALLGFALLLFRNQSLPRLLIWAGIFLALPVLQYLLMWLLTEPRTPSTPEQTAEWVAFMEQVQVAMSTGSLGEWFYYNLGGAIMGRWPELLFTGRPFRVLGLFLIGFAIGRSGWLETLASQRRVLTRVLALGLAVGLPINALRAGFGDTAAYFNLEASGLWYSLLVSVGAPSLALGYAAGFLLLAQRLAWLVSWLAPVGRMALSNYLLQTVFGLLLFSTLGLGLGGQFSLSGGVLMALPITVVLLLWSPLWLRRFRQGPAEWAWRSLACG